MTTNSQYHWKEYKRKDYGPIKEYKLTNKPKYHEYKSYHEYGKIKEYNKIRNYEHREYKPKRLNHNGYRPEARLAKQKVPLLPKRERQYNRMRWFRQIKHCYKLPMGPEYPVRDYKVREYKRKKEKLDYHEYKGYKPFKGYPEYNGSVHYKLTPLNYYGFRRGKRVYRPITPDPYPIPPMSEPVYPQQTVIKHTEEIIQPQPTSYKPIAPAPEIVYPQQVVIMPMQQRPMEKPREEYKQTIRDDNGMYKLQHPVEYHPYNSYHEYDKSYHPYQYKPYNHMFLYTAKDSPDQKPHIVRQDRDIKGIYYNPEKPNKVAPVQLTKSWKPTFAKEPKLPQQVLILPSANQPVLKYKKIPNQREPVYPQQTLIKPFTPIPVVVAEEKSESVVQREEVRTVQRAPRLGPVVAPIMLPQEESQVLVAPIAPKAPKYIPTYQTYRELDSVIVTAPRQVKPLPPVQTVSQPIRESPEAVKIVPVPLVASAPPPKPVPKYKPTNVEYTEESQILTLPKPASTQVKVAENRLSEQRQKTPEPVKVNPVIVPIVAAKANQKRESPKIIPTQVAVNSAKDSTPAEVKQQIQAESKPVPVEQPKPVQVEQPRPVPVPIVATSSNREDKPKPIPVPVVNTKPTKSSPPPKSVDIPQPVPAPEPQKQHEPKPEKVKSPPPNIGPIATIPVFKQRNNPTPEPIEAKPTPKPEQKPKFTAIPVLPPQPPISKPQPKPSESKTEQQEKPITKSKPKPVESKPEPEPQPEPELPKTPPNVRAPIRRPSPPPAPSPPLEIPPPIPAKPKSKAPAPAPTTSLPVLDREMLGALGSVKRTLFMMG